MRREVQATGSPLSNCVSERVSESESVSESVSVFSVFVFLSVSVSVCLACVRGVMQDKHRQKVGNGMGDGGVCKLLSCLQCCFALDCCSGWLSPAVDFISQARKAGTGLLVHCMWGVSRAPTVVIPP